MWDMWGDIWASECFHVSLAHLFNGNDTGYSVHPREALRLG